jgi:hypothetical protein
MKGHSMIRVLALLLMAHAAFSQDVGQSFIDAFSAGNVDDAMQFVSPEAVCENKGPKSGPDIVKKWCAQIKKAGGATIKEKRLISDADVGPITAAGKSFDLKDASLSKALKAEGAKSYIVTFTTIGSRDVPNVFVFDVNGMLIFLADGD